MSAHEVTPLIIRKQVACILERSMFDTLQQAFDGISVDWSAARDGLMVIVRKGDFSDGLLIDRDHLTWSLDHIFGSYTLQDMLFKYWARGMAEARDER